MMIPDWLIEMGRNIIEQDNRCTADPIFEVQEYRRTYGMDPDYCDDTVWVHCDGPEADAEETAELDAISESGEDVPDCWTLTGFIDQWVHVQSFFTEKAAQDFIDCQRHHYGKTRIYVTSAYRNPEWRMVREWIIQTAQEKL